MLESFVDAIQPGLEWADDLLTRYGRWADSRSRGRRSCGSAEGNYRAPAVNDDDARRTPSMVLLNTPGALRVQRTLTRVPDRERTVLHVLYVPNRLPVVAQLRLLQVTPKTCRERHASGLRMFANLYQLHPAREVA